jgi:hypothetical protein
MIHVYAKEELVTDDEKRKRKRILSIKKKVFFCFQPLEPPGGWKCYSHLGSLSNVAGIF